MNLIWFQGLPLAAAAAGARAARAPAAPRALPPARPRPAAWASCEAWAVIAVPRDDFNDVVQDVRRKVDT